MTTLLDTHTVVLGGLMATRCMSFLAGLPALGLRNVPMVVRFAMAMAVAMALLPTLDSKAVALPESIGPLALAMALEIFAGVLMAFGVSLIFAAVQFAGHIIGIQIGFSLVNVVDPQSENQVSAISHVYYLLAVLIFFAIDGPILTLRAIHESFLLHPPGTFVLSAAGLLELAQSFAWVFAQGLKIALPVVLTLLLVSMSLGIVGRTIPQLNILVLGFPIKILVGVLVLSLSLSIVGDVVASEIARIPDQVRVWSGTALVGR